jgi:hypothetical protein
LRCQAQVCPRGRIGPCVAAFREGIAMQNTAFDPLGRGIDAVEFQRIGASARIVTTTCF